MLNILFKSNDVFLSGASLSFRDNAYNALMKSIDMQAVVKLSKQELLTEIENFLEFYTRTNKISVSKRDRNAIASDIVDDMVGLGPIGKLLDDDDITDIVINKFDSIYVEKNGLLQNTNIKFRDENHLIQIAQRIAQKVGRRIDTSNPICDARLEDGSRVNIVFPPVAVDGVSISIRKFSAKKLSLEQITENGSMSLPMMTFLKIASKSALNIIVAGGTGSGKTTLLNALSFLINDNVRIVTCEDAAELQLQQTHVVRLESRDPNMEGNGEIAIRDLLRTALRMRPDRIIIGEVRGDECVDMLQAMNTGHDGSMSTIHANSPIETVMRMENMILMAGINLPVSAIRTQILNAIDIIIQTERLYDGSRKITEIAEVSKIENGEVVCTSIFKFIPDGVKNDKVYGHFESLNKLPKFMEKIRKYGLENELIKVLNIDQTKDECKKNKEQYFNDKHIQEDIRDRKKEGNCFAVDDSIDKAFNKSDKL